MTGQAESLPTLRVDAIVVPRLYRALCRQRPIKWVALDDDFLDARAEARLVGDRFVLLLQLRLGL